MFSQLLIGALALVASVNAAAHDIDVGEDGQLRFNPDSITAAVGDTLNFHFYSASGPHSVLSSTFEAPCVPKDGAFFSGYIDGDDKGDVTFVVNVTSTDPIYFYCSQDHHCQNGMGGAVNAPSGSGASQYLAAAKAAPSAKDLSAPTGGTVVTESAGSSATSSATSSKSESESSSKTASSESSAKTTESSAAVKTSTSGSAAASTTSAAATSAAAGGSSGGGSSSGASASKTAGPVTTNGVAKNGLAPVLVGLAVAVGGLVALMA